MTRPPRARFAAALGALTLAALLLRLLAGRRGAVISRDGIDYLRLGEQLLAGRLDEALAHHYPPGLPALLAAAGALAGRLDEPIALAAVAVASSALVPAVGLLARRAFGPQAGLFAALLAAVLPLAVELGGEVLADGPYLALVAWGLVLVQRALEGDRAAGPCAAGAALLGGAAYLVRPEGLVVLAALAAGLALAPRPASARRRALDLLWFALPGALAIAPYLLAIAGRPGLEGGGAGLQLTLKRDLALRLAELEPAAALARALHVARYGVKALAPALPLLAAAAWLGPRLPAPRAAAGRRLAALALLLGLGLLAAFALVRADRRFGLQLALLALPFAGLGAERAARWLRARRPGGRARLAVALAALLTCLPFAWRVRHDEKRSYRLAGALLRTAGARRVLAHDSRAAYYAGAVSLPLLVHLPDPADRLRVEALVAALEREEADALVLIAEDEPQRALTRAVAERLRVAPIRLQAPDAVPLAVFVLRRGG